MYWKKNCESFPLHSASRSARDFLFLRPLLSKIVSWNPPPWIFCPPRPPLLWTLKAPFSAILQLRNFGSSKRAFWRPDREKIAQAQRGDQKRGLKILREFRSVFSAGTTRCGGSKRRQSTGELRLVHFRFYLHTASASAPPSWIRSPWRGASGKLGYTEPRRGGLVTGSDQTSLLPTDDFNRLLLHTLNTTSENWRLHCTRTQAATARPSTWRHLESKGLLGSSLAGHGGASRPRLTATTLWREPVSYNPNPERFGVTEVVLDNMPWKCLLELAEPFWAFQGSKTKSFSLWFDLQKVVLFASSPFSPKASCHAREWVPTCAQAWWVPPTRLWG